MIHPDASGEHAALTVLTDVRPERIDWLWPGYLARGKLHVIDGDPGLGKSTITLDLVARATTGTAWPDGQAGGPPAGAVLLSAEDGLADTIRPRLDAAGADAERIAALTDIRALDPATGEWATRMPALPTDTETIRDALVKLDAALLVIDPLMAYLDGNVNAHRDQDIRRALAPLMRVADETRTAVLLVRHLTKGDASNAVYRGGGSIGIIGAARLGYAIARDPNDEARAVLAATKANIAAMPQALAYHLEDDQRHGCARIEWDGPVGYTAGDLLKPPAEPDPTTEWLTAYLTEHEGQAPASEVLEAAEKAGIAERTLYRARTRAGVTTQRAGFQGPSMWWLPVAMPDGIGNPPSRQEASDGRAGRCGRTGMSEATQATDVGPCALCGSPVRRYGSNAEGPICGPCRDGPGGTALAHRTRKSTNERGLQ